MILEMCHAFNLNYSWFANKKSQSPLCAHRTVMGTWPVPADFYIVYKVTPILGKGLFAALNLKVLNEHVAIPQPNTTAEQTAATEGRVEDKFGLIHKFVHKTEVQCNVTH